MPTILASYQWLRLLISKGFLSFFKPMNVTEVSLLVVQKEAATKYLQTFGCALHCYHFDLEAHVYIAHCHLSKYELL